VQTRLDLSTQLARYEASRRRGVSFLLAQIGADGAVADAGRPRFGYYRVPWALEVSGETAAAAAVLDWVERACLADDGHIHGGVAWTPAANATVNTYAETCIAYGAWLLRRFDIARRTMAFARQFQDPETGGIWMTREETGPDGRQLLFPTCQYGMSAVIAGDIASAIRVGEWLERLWEAQPALPDKLYTIWTRSGGLATEIPAGENPKHYLNDARVEQQYHYNGGIAAACLAHLHMATGDARWLDLGRAYQRFSMETTPDQFAVKQICKSAWGSGLLTLAGRDDSYLPWLQRMGDWFADGQDADGGWSNTITLDPDPPLAHRIEVTAEFVVHMDTLITALAAIAARNA
jgi:hypothetical protein